MSVYFHVRSGGARRLDSIYYLSVVNEDLCLGLKWARGISGSVYFDLLISGGISRLGQCLAISRSYIHKNRHRSVELHNFVPNLYGPLVAGH